MAKTKTFGIRLSHELINEVERLKCSFAFGSYAEMVESLIYILKSIDECISQIKEHPRNWSPEELQRYLPLDDGHEEIYCNIINNLILRRLKQRFGEDGLERVQQLREQYSLITR